MYRNMVSVLKNFGRVMAIENLERQLILGFTIYNVAFWLYK
jgi:hypothetical protein